MDPDDLYDSEDDVKMSRFVCACVCERHRARVCECVYRCVYECVMGDGSSTHGGDHA